MDGIIERRFLEKPTVGKHRAFHFNFVTRYPPARSLPLPDRLLFLELRDVIYAARTGDDRGEKMLRNGARRRAFHRENRVRAD